MSRYTKAQERKHQRNLLREFRLRPPTPKIVSPLPPTPEGPLRGRSTNGQPKRLLEDFILSNDVENQPPTKRTRKQDYEDEVQTDLHQGPLTTWKLIRVDGIPPLCHGVDPWTVHPEDPRRFSVRRAYREVHPNCT